jgi:excisionase family DNA binding protein
MNDDALLTTRDVAAHCGLSTRAVYDAIRRGELKAIRICSRIRIRPEDRTPGLPPANSSHA